MNFAEILAWGAGVGLGATLVTDIVAIMRQGWAATNGFYRLVGRWIGSIPRIGFVHTDIRTSPVVSGETTLGWGAHVATGVVFGITFILVFGRTTPGFLAVWQGLGFGLATVLVPWLIFQPLFGWGIAAARTPAPWKQRLKSLVTHGTFGVGLWLSAMLLNLLAPAL